MEETTDIGKLYNALLYSCTTPAFIWSAKTGELLLANTMGFEMFTSFGIAAETSEMDRLIRNWREIPETLHHPFWFEFLLKDGGSKHIQVRNSCLDESQQIIASVVLNSKWSSEQLADQNFEVFVQIVRNAAATFCSRTDFLERFSSFLNFCCLSLDLSDFVFLPADIFVSYDLYDEIAFIANEHSCYTMIEPYLLGLEKAPFRQIVPLSQIFPDAPSSIGVYSVETDAQMIGWFILSFRAENYYQNNLLHTLLEVVSVFFQGLFEKMELTKSLYQSDFENSLNGQIIENISEGVIIANNDYKIVYINRKSALMFGFSPKDVVGHQLNDLLVTHEGVDKLVHVLSNADVSSDDLPAIQYLHRRSGERFPCHIRLTNLNIDEKSQYTIFVLTDITDTEESRLKTEQLAQRAFLGDFASLMAHEIRNPINNMNIWIQNIKSAVSTEDEIFTMAKRLEEDSSRVSHLITNILAFSRPLKLSFEPVDLSAYLQETLERWKLNFARANIKYYFTPQDDFPRVMIDPRSMEQVMNNLIGNAIDAFDSKGGVISLKLSLSDSGAGRKQALISVSDNGPGIPDDLIDHIFEPFVTSKKKGNGWGLALSKRIITSHKGTIQVKSYPGGTVFEIFLPLNFGG